MKYSKTTGGFYDAAIHGDNIPSDAVEISADDHAALLAGQSIGKRIITDTEGRPVLADLPTPSAEDRAAAVSAARQAAYRADSDPLFFKAQRGDASMADWLAAVAEIKARFPYPEGAA